MSRREYLDWLRGVAVLIMVQTHLLDSWVHTPDRAEPAFRWALVLGGFSAPLFLFLAGIAMALSYGSRLRQGRALEAAARLRHHGWQVVGLAFLFRLQALLVSGGAFPDALLRVDILNVMGVSMIVASVLWSPNAGRPWRAARLLTGGVVVAMITPLVRTTPMTGALPSAIAAYLEAPPASGAFSLFPWSGFLLVGAAIGVWLDSTRTREEERRALVALAVVGPLLATAGYIATFLPALYAGTTFWTGSPTYFFVRVGILMAAIPVAFVCNRWDRRSPIRDFGLASLFVYWVHVELVYGVPSLPLHGALGLAQAVPAFVVLAVFLLALIRVKPLMSAPLRDAAVRLRGLADGHRPATALRRVLAWTYR